MKTIVLFVFALAVIISCGQQELSIDEAVTLLRKESAYPRVFDLDIFCGDPLYAQGVLDKVLEANGLIVVHRRAKLKDFGKGPIIEFTPKSKASNINTAR